MRVTVCGALGYAMCLLCTALAVLLAALLGVAYNQNASSAVCANERVAASACVSDATWTDGLDEVSAGLRTTCAQYDANPEWCALSTATIGSTPAIGMRASDACCACGGSADRARTYRQPFGALALHIYREYGSRDCITGSTDDGVPFFVIGDCLGSNVTYYAMPSLYGAVMVRDTNVVTRLKIVNLNLAPPTTRVIAQNAMTGAVYGEVEPELRVDRSCAARRCRMVYGARCAEIMLRIADCQGMTVFETGPCEDGDTSGWFCVPRDIVVEKDDAWGDAWEGHMECDDGLVIDATSADPSPDCTK